MRAAGIFDLVRWPIEMGWGDLLGAIVEGVAKRFVEAGYCFSACHEYLYSLSAADAYRLRSDTLSKAVEQDLVWVATKIGFSLPIVFVDLNDLSSSIRNICTICFCAAK